LQVAVVHVSGSVGWLNVIDDTVGTDMNRTEFALALGKKSPAPSQVSFGTKFSSSAKLLWGRQGKFGSNFETRMVQQKLAPMCCHKKWVCR